MGGGGGQRLDLCEGSRGESETSFNTYSHHACTHTEAPSYAPALLPTVGSMDYPIPGYSINVVRCVVRTHTEAHVEGGSVVSVSVNLTKDNRLRGTRGLVAFGVHLDLGRALGGNVEEALLVCHYEDDLQQVLACFGGLRFGVWDAGLCFGLGIGDVGLGNGDWGLGVRD